MKLKDIKYYYYKLNNLLNDGDNDYIKAYTTNGFIKAKDMWDKYSHKSIDEFFNDFSKDYSEEYLIKNCNNCFEKISRTNHKINKDQLFDILLRRLVLDAFIGFKAEDIIRGKLINYGINIESNKLDNRTKKLLDTKYNVDIIVYDSNGDVINLIQVKNKTTFSNNGSYIQEKRKEFIEKEKSVNKLLNTNIKVKYYIYDKFSFIDKGYYEFFINEKTNKCCFTIDQLIDNNGKLIVKLNKKKEL